MFFDNVVYLNVKIYGLCKSNKIMYSFVCFFVRDVIYGSGLLTLFEKIIGFHLMFSLKWDSKSKNRVTDFSPFF